MIVKIREIKQPVRKGTESQNYFRTQIEQFEPILSSLKLGSEQNGKFECLLSLSLRN
jgi:hypothetical protein